MSSTIAKLVADVLGGHLRKAASSRAIQAKLDVGAAVLIIALSGVSEHRPVDRDPLLDDDERAFLTVVRQRLIIGRHGRGQIRRGHGLIDHLERELAGLANQILQFFADRSRRGPR